jgi:uncharacterized membrane protein YeaQ/YmgE (transglycosylase-associated protein family)
MGGLMTLGLGLVGSIVGEFVSSVTFGPDSTEPGLHASGRILSTIGTVIALAAYLAFQNRRLDRPRDWRDAQDHHVAGAVYCSRCCELS